MSSMTKFVARRAYRGFSRGFGAAGSGVVPVLPIMSGKPPRIPQGEILRGLARSDSAIHTRFRRVSWGPILSGVNDRIALARTIPSWVSSGCQRWHFGLSQLLLSGPRSSDSGKSRARASGLGEASAARRGER